MSQTTQMLSQGIRFDLVVGHDAYLSLVRERFESIAAYVNGRVLLRPTGNWMQVAGAGLDEQEKETKVRVDFSDYRGTTIESGNPGEEWGGHYIYSLEMEGGSAEGPPVDTQKALADFEVWFREATISDGAVVKMHCLALITGTDEDAENKSDMPMGRQSTVDD